MDQSTINMMMALLSMLISFYCFYLVNQLRKRPRSDKEAFSSRPLQLQAYERLVLLTERISLPNLVSRANANYPELNARSAQLILIESVKQEVEYNTTQQIYVSPVAWEAVKNLKDQTILIVNQVAASLPPEASGLDLYKALLDFVMTQKKGALHTVILEALNYEAKKMMK
ncbi:MAG TPA: hypothetical protein VFD56_09015 [Chitinophagaceae bacterium]|nr:hypothetical protein [Chitinophagaceae bacterium]